MQSPEDQVKKEKKKKNVCDFIGPKGVLVKM